MPDFDKVRKWPLWRATLANRIFRWTGDYCAGGCGYPVGTKYLIEIDNIDGVPVRAAACSLGGDCEYNVRNDPRDETGRPYADIRPDVVVAIRDARAANLSPNNFVLSFHR